MIAVTVAALLVLTALNVAVRRSFLYPPAVFSGTWTAFLFWLLLVGDRFFPISPKTLGIFLLGGFSLSLGGFLVSLLPGSKQRTQETATRPDRVVSRVLDLGFWACLLAFPVRVLRLRELAGSEVGTNLLSPTFWFNVRRASLAESDENKLSGLALTDNIILVASFLALASLARDAQRGRTRLTTMGIVALALVYNMMTAGRSGAMAFMCGLVAITWMALRRLPWKVMVPSLMVGALVFSLPAVFLYKGGSVTASAEENVAGIWESFELYGLGGIVAFDHTVREPNDIQPVWTATRSFTQVANKLGGRFELPSLNADYSQISNDEWMNAYTMYFAYFPHFGWAGVAAFPFVVGMVLTWLFGSAQVGDPRARLVYAAAVAGLVLSAFGELFFMNITFLLKATAFSWVLYGLPRTHAASDAEGTIVRKTP